MSATVLYMSMSLDGFIAGPNEGPDNGLGDGAERLHDWAMTGGANDVEVTRRLGGVNGKVLDEMMSTGAVVAGRGTFEPAGGWGGDHHDGVPIFILTRHDPADLRQWPLVTYVNDVTTAMTQAKKAAGDNNVLVHGAGTAQRGIAAGVLEEMELHVTSVLFGQGRRLFEGLAPEQVELQRTRILEGRTVSPTCTTGSGAEVSGPPPSPSRRMAGVCAVDPSLVVADEQRACAGSIAGLLLCARNGSRPRAPASRPEAEKRRQSFAMRS
jgi:dihydrofolate reductase